VCCSYIGTKGTGATKGTKGTKGTGATKGTKGTKGTGATKGTKGTKGTGATKGTKGTKGTGATKGTKGTKGSGATKGTKGTKGSGATKGTKVTGPHRSTKGPNDSSESSECSDEDGKSSRSPRPSGHTKATKASGASKATKGTRPTKASNGTYVSGASKGTKGTGGTKRTRGTGATKATKVTGPHKSTKGPMDSSESSECSDENGKSSRRPRPSGHTKATKATGATKGTRGPKKTRGTKATRGPMETDGTFGSRATLRTGRTHGTQVSGGMTSAVDATHVIPRTTKRQVSRKAPEDNSESSDSSADVTKPSRSRLPSGYTKKPRPSIFSKRTKQSGITKGTRVSTVSKATRVPSNGTAATHGSPKPGVTTKSSDQTSKGPNRTRLPDEGSSSESHENGKKSSRQPRPSGGSKRTKPVRSTKAAGTPKTRRPGANTKRTRPTVTEEQIGCSYSKTPCEIDCQKGHKISSQGDLIVGVLIVKKCASKQFAKGSSNLQAVAKQLTLLVNRQLAKKAVKVLQKVQFVKVIGDKTQTRFHYMINARKEFHDELKAALSIVCKEKELRETIDEQQRRSCGAHSSSSDSDENKGPSRKTRKPHRGPESDSSDSSTSSESSEDKPKPTRKTEVTKRRTGRIIRILSTSADVPYKHGGHYDSACARCALRKISSTLLLEGVSLKEMSSRLCGRFPQNFKYILASEVRKYQRVGLKSIEITTISTDKKQNLVIEFDIIVDPQYNKVIRNALQRAVVSLDLQRVFKYQAHY